MLAQEEKLWKKSTLMQEYVSLSKYVNKLEKRITNIEIELKISSQIEPNRAVDFEIIFSTVCDYYKMNYAYILSKSKKRSYMIPRHVICYLSRKHTQMTLMDIGAKMGNRDHTTVLHSINTADDLLSYDTQLQFDIKELKQRLHL
jgi:chromosomal replication initiator protein